MIVLKNNFNHCHLTDTGIVTQSEDKAMIGLFFADVRLFKRYEWQFGPFDLLQKKTSSLTEMTQFWALLSHHYQRVSLVRSFSITAHQCIDTLVFENHTNQAETLNIGLMIGFDATDAMTLRGVGGAVKAERVSEGSSFSVRFPDGRSQRVSYKVTLDEAELERLPESITLQPGESRPLSVTITYEASSYRMPAYQPGSNPYTNQSVSSQSWNDLIGLLFNTEQGVVPAAGIPRFVCPFGRDSLLTAFFVKESLPEIALGTLHFLAHHIGRTTDPRRDEEPGKILHEYRWGPASQSNAIPFAPYYGSADATALFVWLWAEMSQGEHAESLSALWPAVESAVDWLLFKLDEGQGFIRFRENKQGLVYQGWKDSSISMCHQDGRLASGAIAVVEVQGYTWAALSKIDPLVAMHSDEKRASAVRQQAQSLYDRIQTRLWDDELQFYVMGLDGNDETMRVISSNAGHLLWAGAVPQSRAAPMAERLFDKSMWSGWGFRTLAAGEKGYNELSYHNGSVWPHDTGLVAWGLRNYGFEHEFQSVALAVHSLAKALPDLRLPELISGYERADDAPPIPYPGTCIPQAWSAAALLYLSDRKNM
ncbi:amylo-alpha-1,6-glucosidase [Reinekea marinisedimentorum]|uniref:Amylo-alpha-1,6-glucosidase n=1 Tax=Reinekea marinisedimentorum TaxID=230495 RepID=A0A4R3I9M5_9GAMM|nr:glycogen debranching N-terminal domain-containing protein [Reinekea marinisedimentorum]TCS43108.1 amylo-alpha-1,6-glucosidase [Reinekea marinisedimentorum]